MDETATVAILAVAVVAAVLIVTSDPAQGQTLLRTAPPPPSQNPVVEAVISKIPVVGPILGPVEAAAGKAIVSSPTLTQHSQVAPGRSENKAGIFGFTVGHGVKWSTVGKDIKAGAKDTWNFVSSGKIVEPWKW